MNLLWLMLIIGARLPLMNTDCVTSIVHEKTKRCTCISRDILSCEAGVRVCHADFTQLTDRFETIHLHERLCPALRAKINRMDFGKVVLYNDVCEAPFNADNCQ
jgi:hypothetical protein